MVATFGTTEDFQRLLQQQLTDETTNGLVFIYLYANKFCLRDRMHFLSEIVF